MSRKIIFPLLLLLTTSTESNATSIDFKREENVSREFPNFSSGQEERIGVSGNFYAENFIVKIFAV